MSRDQPGMADLLLSLDGSELQEVERVRTTVNQQLSSDRGGAVLSSLVEHFLDSSSSQAALLLSSIREPHHKVLLEKLNEALNRPGSRAAAVTLLGHLIRKQPPWVHHVSRSPVLPSLLRCLKTDGDVVVLVTGVLVLITLLPMIPQAGKQYIYDFFDVFGRLVSWSYRNPGQVSVAYLVHLHAALYSLFHRLYGMFPCNFVSYLRLHYSMKENMDTFQELVKPMLEQVRIHPELVTGTQDQELDPSRWRRYEVHDIIIECSRLSLDPLESSCEEDIPHPTPPSSPHPHLDPSSAHPEVEPISSLGSSIGRPQRVLNFMQADDVTWSPSSRCGLTTPPPEAAATVPAPSSTSASVAVATSTDSILQVKQQPIRAKEEMELSDVIKDNLNSADVARSKLRTSTPSRDDSGLPTPLCLSPPPPAQVCGAPDPAPPYESLFELALPRAATLFIERKTQEALERSGGEQKKEEQSSISPLKVLDQMIENGNDVHQRLSRRFSAGTRSMERSQLGGKQQSMRSKGSAQGEELQALRSQLLLVHSQLHYERFKRQQHAIRNRRLLRRVINATALEEQAVAMKAQLSVQDQEIQALRASLDREQKRFTELKQNTQTQTELLHTQLQQLLLQQQDRQQEKLQLQSELAEFRSRLEDLEAELQRANNKANQAERRLRQLCPKLCSSEQLQQQIFLLNQQLLLLRETNRGLREQLEDGGAHSWTEEAMLQRCVETEVQRLKDSDALQRQKLEATNHRIAELEIQLAKKEKLILDQKKLLEDTKNQSRAELSASESRCVALRRTVQNLQTEMLLLYSQVDLDPVQHSSRPIRDAASSPNKLRPPSSSAVGIINGAVEALPSSSPLSVPPFDSPLAVGSFLEQQARRLFGPNHQNPEDEEEEDEEEELQPESPPLGQEVEEATLLTGSPLMEAPTVRQRREELSIMDYNRSLPEF